MNTGCPVGSVPEVFLPVLCCISTKSSWDGQNSRCQLPGDRPLSKPNSPSPTVMCQYLTSITQMGQFILMLTDGHLRFTCACEGAVCCHTLRPVSSFRSQEYQATQRLLEIRMWGGWEKSLTIFKLESRFKATGSINGIGRSFSLGECLQQSWRTFPFLLWLWSIWLVHRETWLSSPW